MLGSKSMIFQDLWNLPQSVSRAFHQNEGGRSAGWCLECTVKVKEIQNNMAFSLEQYGWKQFATWEPLAVFSSERKASCLKKTKRLKERPLGVKKKIQVHNLLCQTRTCDIIELHICKYSALPASHNDVKKTAMHPANRSPQLSSMAFLKILFLSPPNNSPAELAWACSDSWCTPICSIPASLTHILHHSTWIWNSVCSSYRETHQTSW